MSYLYISSSLHCIKKYVFIAGLLLLLPAAYGQSPGPFGLPPSLAGIIPGKSTEADVKKALGRPAERDEIKKDQCTAIEHPRNMFYQYEQQKIDIMFRRKNKRSAYIVDHIGFSIGTPVVFGNGIVMGQSKKAEIVKQFGAGINEPDADLCYEIKGEGLYYSFLTDDNNVLVRVLICQTRNCL